MRAILRSMLMVSAAMIFIALGFMIGTTVIDGRANEAAPVVADGPVFSSATAYRVADSPAQDITLDQDVVLAQDQEDERAISDIRAALYEQLAPSIVSISVAATTVAGLDVSGGSGFVIDEAGHIVTNYHVVEGADEIIVNFFDGTITRAEIVGLDPDSDIAVIRVDNVPSERLRPVVFGDVDTMRVGDSVIAIGSPFGQDWTLTAGIISAKNRNISGLGDYSIGSAIQTDTPINPGNSGGPLINLDGEVIGVNSQILSETRSNSGVGFAVPSDLVVRVAEELIQNGEVAYSFIGISGTNMTLNFMETLGLPNNQRGVVVCSVLDDSPAQAAGLEVDGSECGRFGRFRSADIILAINDTPMQTMENLISYLARETRPGDTINLTVLRDGETVNLPLTLANRSDF